MATTTVRLDPEEERILAELAPQYGGKSGALREALRRLADDANHRRALADLVDEWNAADGEPSEDEVQAMIERYDH